MYQNGNMAVNRKIKNIHGEDFVTNQLMTKKGLMLFFHFERTKLNRELNCLEDIGAIGPHTGRRKFTAKEVKTIIKELDGRDLDDDIDL